MLAFILNLFWFVLGGFFMGLLWFFYGALWSLTIVGLPIGVACFRFGAFVMWPFGRRLIPAQEAGGITIPGTGCMNVLWFVFSGFWLFLGHLALAVAECATILGIPLGLAHLQIAFAALSPLGKRIVASHECFSLSHPFE